MASQMKVLVADDDSVMLETLAALLTQAGYQVLTAVNGLEAVDLAKKELPSLILLDIHMPELDGLKACRILKTNLVTKPIPIIMLTVDGRINEIRRAIDYGAKTYITKPSSKEEILKVVKSILY
jgi:two-component system alkaline phosphatase synthesis response regulator PhoP